MHDDEDDQIIYDLEDEDQLVKGGQGRSVKDVHNNAMATGCALVGVVVFALALALAHVLKGVL